MMQEQIDKEEAQEMIQQRLESILPYSQKDTQSECGKLFEILADLTDDDGALAEMQDINDVSGLLSPAIETTPRPTGENLLDQASHEKLPPLYSGEEKGLDAIAPVKLFTQDSS